MTWSQLNESDRRAAHSRLQVNQNCSRDVMLVVCLIEEDILPVALAAFCRPILQQSCRGDPMFGAELLPELRVSYRAKRWLESRTWWPTGRQLKFWK